MEARSNRTGRILRGKIAEILLKRGSATSFPKVEKPKTKKKPKAKK
jgi:hypothetical protein